MGLFSKLWVQFLNKGSIFDAYFAVSTPGCVELDQDVFGFIPDDLLVGVGNDDFHGTVVLPWRLLRFVLGSNFALAGER